MSSDIANASLLSRHSKGRHFIEMCKTLLDCSRGVSYPVTPIPIRTVPVPLFVVNADSDVSCSYDAWIQNWLNSLSSSVVHGMASVRRRVHFVLNRCLSVKATSQSRHFYTPFRQRERRIRAYNTKYEPVSLVTSLLSLNAIRPAELSYLRFTHARVFQCRHRLEDKRD